MIELIRKQGVLYAKALLDLRIPIEYKGVKYHKGEGMLLELDIIHQLLIRNGNVRLFDGKDYIRLNFVQVQEIVKRNNYRVVDYVEPKKEKVVVQQHKEEPKQQPVQEIKEEPKQQPVQEIKEEPKQQEAKKEHYKQQNQNDNKKQRHINNNNKQQGGDK